RAQLPQTVEGQAVGELLIVFQLTAEEERKCRGQQRSAVARRRPAQQRRQVGRLGGQSVRDLGDDAVGGSTPGGRLGEAIEAGRLPGQVRRRDAARGQPARFSQPLQLVETTFAQVGGRFLQADGGLLQ